jgi:PAS domain S-box-containing protein
MAIRPANLQGSGTGADRVQLLIDALSDCAIYMLDPDGRVASWNAGAQQVKGYRADEIIGEHFSRFYTPEDRARGEPERVLQIARSEGKYEQDGCWRVRKDGTRFWASLLVDPIIDAGGELIGYAKVTRDITERRDAEQALRASEQRFRLLVQGVSDYAIYMLDAEGLVSNWNLGAERIKGYSEAEIVGQHFSRFYTDEEREQGMPQYSLRMAAEAGRYEREGWRVRKDGTRFWASVVIDAIRDECGVLVGYAKVTRDITERRRAQEELERTRAALMQSQKMEAVGHLTGGIAHDFNNLLTVIVNSLELLARHSHTPAETRLIENAARAADRGAKLTQQLLAFGRRQPLEPAQHSINRLIEGFEPLLRRACGEQVELQLQLQRGLEQVNIDAAEFEAGLLNLAVNARDAMPEGGTLLIRTEGRELTADQVAAKSGMRTGACVVLSVVDSGSGMSPETQARAFEPYYTTKEIGKGTGLGLSQVYGLVMQSGGHIEIDSAPGQGTTVRMFLSGCGVPAEATGEPAARPTVLIVDDEPDVLDIAVELFRDLGYQVLTAPDAVRALPIVQRDASLDLLFSDVVMPRGMSGLQLAQEARRLRPGLPILLASGYALPSAVGASAPPREFEFIGKPYRFADLVDKLRRLGIGDSMAGAAG